MEVRDGRPEDMTRVVEGEFDIGCDIGHATVVEGDRVLHVGPHLVRGVGDPVRLLPDDVQVVELEHRREIPRRRRRVDRAFVAVLVEERDESAVVEMRVGEHHRVERVEGVDLGHVEVRRPVRDVARFFPAVDQDLALRRRYQERGAADLAAAPERRDPQPLVLARDLAVDTAADRTQKRLALVFDRSQVGADLLHRRTLDGRRPDNLRRPADLLRDLAESHPVLADDDAGLLRLDQDFAGLGIEEEVGDPCVLRNDRTDLLGGPFGIFKNVRAHDDPLPQIACQYLYQVCLIGKQFRIVCVDNELGTFKLDVRDRYSAGNNLIDLLLKLLEFLFDNH